MISYRRSFNEVLRALGERGRQLRLQRLLGQAELAARADVGIATVRRFEKTGSASIENVLRIATALDADGAFDKLFEPPEYASIDDAASRPERTARRRAPRRR